MLEEAPPTIINSTNVRDVLSRNEALLMPEEFEAVISLIPGLPYPPEFLQEVLRNFRIIQVRSSHTPNPDVFWHCAEIPYNQTDRISFSLARMDSYIFSHEKGFHKDEPLVTKLVIGVERTPTANNNDDRSIHAYYYFLENGDFEKLDVAAQSNGRSDSWITIYNETGVGDYRGKLSDIGSKLATLESINLAFFINRFVDVSKPINLSEAFQLESPLY